MEKPNDKVDNPSVNGKDSNDNPALSTLNPSKNSANDDLLNRISNNMPNKQTNMTNGIDGSLDQLQANTIIKPETRDRFQSTIKSKDDSSLGNNKDLTTVPATDHHNSSEPKPSTLDLLVDNNKAKYNKMVTGTSPQMVKVQTSTSFTPIQQTSVQLSKKFEEVQRTINSRDVKELKRTLAQLQRISDPQVDPQLMQLSLRAAILSGDIRIVDVVYEHWSSIADTELLGRVLEATRVSCKDHLEKDQQLYVDVHCIIEFNEFKIELSRVLFDLRTAAHSSAFNPQTWEGKGPQTVQILTTVIDIYDKFCKKNIRATKHLDIDRLVLQKLLDDKTSIYFRYLCYVIYENYYRKLDFYIAGVLMEHFHSLKLRLELPSNGYQELESALYYFIYRVKEYWRLYIPENRTINKFCFPIGNSPYCIKIPYDPSRLLNGPTIYLEWEKFKLSVKQFQQELKNPNVIKRPEKSKLPPDEVNTLTLLPFLRDEHSLRKVMQYLEAGEHAIQGFDAATAALVVQRMLQVTGEYFKSSDTVHLSSTTRALLQVFIPVSTLDHLKTLRNDFSHIMKWKKGKPRKPNLIRRINLEETKPDLFFGAAKDLKQIKLALNKVINIYKPILDKSLLQEGINLIADREKDLPTSLTKYKGYLCMPREDSKKVTEKENKLYDEHLSILGIPKQLIREYVELISNDLDLKRKLKEKEKDCMKYIITNIQSFIDCINNSLSEIDCSKSEEKDSVVLKWNTIISLLQFIMEQVKVFQENSEIKSIYSKLHCKLQTVKDDYDYLIKEMSDGATIVRELLDLLNQEANTYSSNNNIILSISQNNAPYNYDGIKKLEKLISKQNYITNKEKEYLESKIGKHRGNEPLLDKVFNNEEMSQEERNTLINTINMDDRCKLILDYVVGNKCRSAAAPQCLAQRATLLKKVIANNDVPSLVEKYHSDEGFRILTEAILFDISVIYADCELLHDVFNDNKRKQFAEFPLRNFLAHGHPLLEVIGQALDPSDLPAALFRSALLVADDAPALVEVANLYEQGVSAEEALAKWNGPQTPRLIHYFTKKFYSLPPS